MKRWNYPAFLPPSVAAFFMCWPCSAPPPMLYSSRAALPRRSVSIQKGGVINAEFLRNNRYYSYSRVDCSDCSYPCSFSNWASSSAKYSQRKIVGIIFHCKNWSLHKISACYFQNRLSCISWRSERLIRRYATGSYFFIQRYWPQNRPLYEVSKRPDTSAIVRWRTLG